MKKISKDKSGFSIIEVLVGIFIFTLGLLSIYMLINGTIRLNETNNNKIIASALANESLELIKNIRDSNYKNLHVWNQTNPNLTSDFSNSDNKFKTGSYYKLENSYLSTGFPIKVEEITNFGEGASEINGRMQDYRLCLDSENRYTYDCLTFGNKKTNFYRYIYIDSVEYNDLSSDIVINNALKIKAKVVWTMKGYNELEIDTVLTDWKRF